MTGDKRSRLLLLQQGDSFFPSGAMVFSWGLETLCEDGLISGAEDLESYLEGQIRGRWHPFECAVVASVHGMAQALESLAAVDRLVEAQTLAEELREGSRKAGRAFIGVHRRLGTPGAGDYEVMIASGGALGHASVVQGMVWARLGLDEEAAMLLSAHQLATAMIGSAIRLGVIGHVAAQRILTRAHSLAASVLEDEPVPDLDNLSAFVPEAEVAVMRHETAASRLFSN
jgi:urease accessory protein